MGTCPNCGNTRLFLRPLSCESCHKAGCDHCLGVYAYTFPIPGRPPVPHWVCSWDCFDRMATYNVGRGLTLSSSGGYWYIGGYQLRPEAAQRAVKIQAEHFVLAERHEDAARLYENIGLWREAGETRRLAQRQVVTQVHINVNDLVEQLHRMGLSASYTCPVCRSPFTITGDTSPDALVKCAYCGSVIRQTDLIEALSRVIGHH